ncbi:hypothetical protein OJJOAM_003515 [Cupriavidus sp. H18C1]
MRGAHRMAGVEPERQPAMGLPVELDRRQPLALHRVDHREIPAQHVDAQPAAAPHQRIEEIAQPARKAVVGAAGHQLEAAVDIPAEDEDGVFRLDQRRAQRAEVLLAIDQHGEARCAFDAPAIAAGLQQRRLVQPCGGCRRTVSRGGTRGAIAALRLRYAGCKLPVFRRVFSGHRHPCGNEGGAAGPGCPADLRQQYGKPRTEPPSAAGPGACRNPPTWAAAQRPRGAQPGLRAWQARAACLTLSAHRWRNTHGR